jgi:hypothetical protein
MSVSRKSSNESLAHEETPLLDPPAAPTKKKWPRSVLYRAFFGAFVISLSFGVTQVPFLYVFRIMTCEAFYETHPPPTDRSVDRCARHEITAGTARAVSILGSSTTIFGLVNLLVTGWTIKRLGVKRALLIQVFTPAVRLAVQNVGVMTGSWKGILIMQCSQIITIIGGPNGYILCLNSFVTDIVEPEERTGAIGRLQGCMLVGAATGMLIGGLIGDAFGIAAPFRLTLILFILCCIYLAICLPAIPLENDIAARKTRTGIRRFLGPLHVFVPQKWVLQDGRTSKQFGALMIGIGVFLAILATGYIPTLLQMYSTDSFDFATKENGWLIFMYSSLRGLYLTFIFPRVIAAGRKWLKPKGHNPDAIKPEEEEQLIRDGAISANGIGPVDNMDNDNEPNNPVKKEKEQETFAFDLVYARASLLTDSVLTGLFIFVNKGWHLFIMAAILPLSAGTGSASKGTILQMIPSSDRVDALAGITLVENIARLSTQMVFGLAFAALADADKSWLIFTCNAGVALIGFTVLCLSRFPPDGSRRMAN